MSEIDDSGTDSLKGAGGGVNGIPPFVEMPCKIGYMRVSCAIAAASSFKSISKFFWLKGKSFFWPFHCAFPVLHNIFNSKQSEKFLSCPPSLPAANQHKLSKIIQNSFIRNIAFLLLRRQAFHGCNSKFQKIHKPSKNSSQGQQRDRMRSHAGCASNH